jgi:hypothetical protein
MIERRLSASVRAAREARKAAAKIDGREDYFVAYYRHRRDSGGVQHTHLVQIPEVSQESVKELFKTITSWGQPHRVLVVCDSEKQCRLAARLADKFLPDYESISEERAMDGGWGPVS